MPQAVAQEPSLSAAEQAKMNFIALFNRISEKKVSPEQVAVMPIGNGIYAADITAKKGNFKNPEFAINSNGNILLNYTLFFGRNDYQQRLKSERIAEEKGEDGVYRFYEERGGNRKEISGFEAFYRLTLQKFVEDVDAVSQQGPESREKDRAYLRSLLYKNELVPDLTVGMSNMGGIFGGISTIFYSAKNGEKVDIKMVPDEKGNVAGNMKDYVRTFEALENGFF